MSGDDPGTRRLLLGPALGWLGTRLLQALVRTYEHEQWVAELPDEIRKHGETKRQPETARGMAKGISRPQAELAQGSKGTRMRQANPGNVSPPGRRHETGWLRRCLTRCSTPSIAMMARVAHAGMLVLGPRAASSCGQGLLLGCALVSVLVLGCRLGPAPLKLVLL